MVLRNAFDSLSTEETQLDVLTELRRDLDLKAEQQRLYMFSTEQFSFITSGHLRGTLINPEGSDRILKLYTIIGFVSQGPVYLTLSQNPILGTPVGLLQRGRNAHRGSTTLDSSSSELRFDTSALVPLSGGTVLGRFPLPANQLNNFRFPPLILPPGVTLGFSVSFPGSSEANLSLQFLEE